jgi:enoyl-CoA hydratase
MLAQHLPWQRQRIHIKGCIVSLDLSFEEQFAVITLNRPEVLNALSFALLDQLDQALDEVLASSARVLIITGAGPKAFCAGADVAELKRASQQGGPPQTARGQAIISRLDTLPIPSVAVVHGLALGGGFELALACTFRIATSGARFALPEIKLGLVPGYGGTQRLARLVGPARALELILSGRTLDAEDALRWGIVNWLGEGEPLALGRQYAQRFSGYSLLASRLARDAVSQGLALSLDQGLRLETEKIAQALASTDAQEGMAAFLEKRSPAFKDC